MKKSTIDQLIINPSYEEPKYCWSYDRDRWEFALNGLIFVKRQEVTA